ncbi:uncharacterized protein [Lolium perenne]|uniref:uncharacterized protein n=1 Tax=Lolium perenne TaxID=4522 RepID=UPI0021EA0D2B|nr:uncharacterized protein LOC127312326 isoform X2 [Lolium perenne]
MAAAAIRYAARRIGDRALLPTQAAVAVKEVQQSLLPRLFHSGKPAYAPRISPFSNPGRGRSSNAKVIDPDKAKRAHLEAKLVEYTKNAASFGLTHILLIALFGNPYTKNIDPSLEL